jgi:hypothetical protein
VGVIDVVVGSLAFACVDEGGSDLLVAPPHETSNTDKRPKAAKVFRTLEQ